jgi:hypothetical protein
MKNFIIKLVNGEEIKVRATNCRIDRGRIEFTDRFGGVFFGVSAGQWIHFKTKPLKHKPTGTKAGDDELGF